MQININIDDTKLSELINKGIEEVDKETIKGLVNSTIQEIFSDPMMVKRMIFDTTVYEHSGNVYFGEIQDWVKKALVSTVTPEDTEKYKKQIYDTLATDGKNIIMETLARAFMESLFTYENRGLFHSEIMRSLSDQNR